MAIAAPRGRADRDEHRFGAFDRLDHIGREGQPAVLDIDLDKASRPGSQIGILPALSAVDLGPVLVDAADAVAKVGEARAGNEADIAGADHRDAHSILLLCQRRGS